MIFSCFRENIYIAIMKKIRRLASLLLCNIRLRWIVLVIVWLLIGWVRHSPQLAEGYARHLYPTLSAVLSVVSGCFPFSVGDCFIYGSVVGLLFYLIYTFWNHHFIKKGLPFVVEYLLWVYVWFYFAWGLNYFREDFFTRSGVKYVAYAPETFKEFLASYTEQLNASYVPFGQVDSVKVAAEVKKGYGKIEKRFGINLPREGVHPKTMLLTRMMSKVGVMGYMGPFWAEFHLNGELLPVQYPAVYAHEMAHILGIAGEAEANLYSYLVCIASDVPEIRFSGYFSLFPYLLGNAFQLLTKEEFEEWKDTLSPEVKSLYNAKLAYWQSRYSPLIGDMQDMIYNWFLKGNNIPSGRKNYSEVIELVIALQESRMFNVNWCGFSTDNH